MRWEVDDRCECCVAIEKLSSLYMSDADLELAHLVNDCASYADCLSLRYLFLSPLSAIVFSLEAEEGRFGWPYLVSLTTGFALGKDADIEGIPCSLIVAKQDIHSTLAIG